MPNNSVSNMAQNNSTILLAATGGINGASSGKTLNLNEALASHLVTVQGEKSANIDSQVENSPNISCDAPSSNTNRDLTAINNNPTRSQRDLSTINNATHVQLASINSNPRSQRDLSTTSNATHAQLGYIGNNPRSQHDLRTTSNATHAQLGSIGNNPRFQRTTNNDFRAQHGFTNNNSRYQHVSANDSSRPHGRLSGVRALGASNPATNTMHDGQRSVRTNRNRERYRNVGIIFFTSKLSPL